MTLSPPPSLPSGAALLEAARALVDVPFRLHGRDPRLGLDCVGVIVASLAACGVSLRVPGGYSLRSSRPPDAAAILGQVGLQITTMVCATGTIALLRTGACQFHFAILSDREHHGVHAHAGLRRVVEGPLLPHWPILQRWHFASPS